MTLHKSSFDNIIFDLGGVVLNIDYGLTASGFRQLGFQAFDDYYSQAKQQELFDRLERGIISDEQFRAELKKNLPEGVEDPAIDAAWNAMLLDLPAERLSLLKRLKSTRRVFLLSNTNRIHMRAFAGYLNKTFGISDLSDYFEKIYYSFALGLRKPDKEIFEHVIQEQSLDTSRTVFIDDSLQHVEGARRAGLHALHLSKPLTILDLFAEV